MNNNIASLGLTITALLASSLLHATAARATDVKPTELDKTCASEVVSNSSADKLDVTVPISDKLDDLDSGADKLGETEFEQAKASTSSNPKLMQKPGKGQSQRCL